MQVFGWISAGFGLLAIGYGTIVLRGIMRRSLRGKVVIRFLRWSLLASVAGLLPPSRHLAPIQEVCMLSVYCSATVVLAWLKFDLLGIWRTVFAFFATVVLYLNVVSLSILMFTHSPLLTLPSAAFGPSFEITQLCLAAIFALLSVLAVRSCHPAWSSYHLAGKSAYTQR